MASWEQPHFRWPRGQEVGGQFLRRVGPHPWEGASPTSTLKGSPHRPGWAGGCGRASLAVHLSQITTEPDGQAASGSHMETVTLVGLWPTLSSVRKIPPPSTGCRLQGSVAIGKLRTMGGSGREQSHGGWSPWQSPSCLYLPRASRWPHAGVPGAHPPPTASSPLRREALASLTPAPGREPAPPLNSSA